MPEISLPNNWEPRPYQCNLWNYLVGGGRRAVAIWHRRAGKDDVGLHFTALASQRRVGTYWYMGPTTVLARRAFWEAINPHSGIRRVHEAFIGPYAPERGQYGLIEREVQDDMILHLVNGSTVQFVGSDNYNNLLGSPPVGLVFSEYAVADPQAWNLLRPILAENHGWAVFVTTPRGENHAAAIYRAARDRDNWFAELLPATETEVFTPETLAEEKAELIALNGFDAGEALFRQEYLCSFSAGLLGSYFGREMEEAARDSSGDPDAYPPIPPKLSRVANVPYDSRFPVHTCWDLGISDTMVCICLQLVGAEIHVIDLIEHTDVGFDWFKKELDKKPYSWGQHLFPHDIAVRELGSGVSRLESLRRLGINGRIVPAQSVPDGINAVRSILGRCWFDRAKCAKLVQALQQYRRQWSDTRKSYSEHPFHDWTSHYVDALKTFATANVKNAQKKEIRYSNRGIV